MAELQKKYITSSQLCERFCKSTRTLLRWQNQFNFPKPDIEKPPKGGYLHPKKTKQPLTQSVPNPDYAVG